MQTAGRIGSGTWQAVDWWIGGLGVGEEWFPEEVSLISLTVKVSRCGDDGKGEVLRLPPGWKGAAGRGFPG